jgi:hypothetical protein
MAVMDYRTRDGIADYGFSIEFNSDIGWRVYIIFQPAYQGSDDSMKLPHLSIDCNGRRYVNWPSKLESLGEAKTIAELWAELMQRYQPAQARAKDTERGDSLLSVSIYLEDGQESTVRDVRSALHAVAADVGCELIAESHPVYGSFWQRFRAKASDPHAQGGVYDRLMTLEHSTRVRLRAISEHQTNTQSTQSTQGLTTIIESLKDEPAAVVQLGSLVIVKAYTSDLGSTILCRTLTVKELQMLEARPDLLRDPAGLMARLTASDEDDRRVQAQ